MLLGVEWADAGCLSSFVISSLCSFSVWCAPAIQSYILDLLCEMALAGCAALLLA